MKKKNTKTGRPKAEINFNLVDKYLQAQCSGAGIADLIGVHPDTLYRAVEDRFKVTFSAYSQQKRQSGKEILRKKLFDLALSGNVTAGIWLSKNYLGFTDKSDVNIELTRLSEDELIYITNSLIQKSHAN